MQHCKNAFTPSQTFLNEETNLFNMLPKQIVLSTKVSEEKRLLPTYVKIFFVGSVF